MDKQYNEDGFIPKHGGYERLITYQKSEIIYDGTFYFAHKYLDRFDRTIDQMVQSARSCKQNIVEASMASGTSKETEIKLTNVARASLEELKKDFEDYIRTRHLKFWDKNHPYYTELTKKHKTLNANYETYRKGIESPNVEVSANVLLSLINVTGYLLAQQIKTLEKNFLEEGGLKERMTQARIDVRRKKAQESENQRPTSNSIAGNGTVSMDLVIKMDEWDKDRKTLEHWQWNTMKAITEGKYPLEGKYIYACLMNLKVLKRAGFVEE